MQELEEAERYAMAALFTLALHSTASQADHTGGIEGWGEPEDDGVSYNPSSIPNSDEPDPFWGRDLVLRGGLLDAVYFQLGLPAFKWPGLKAFPEIAPSSNSAIFKSTVRSLIAVLDEELAETLPAPSAHSRHKDTARRVDVPDELWDGLLSSSDDDNDDVENNAKRRIVADNNDVHSDDAAQRDTPDNDATHGNCDDTELKKDREWERYLEDQQRERERKYRKAAEEDDIWWNVESPVMLDAKQSLLELQKHMNSPSHHALQKQKSLEFTDLAQKLQDDKDGEVADDSTQVQQRSEGHDTLIVGTISSGPSNLTRQRQQASVSPLAVAALWELLQCCIGASSSASEAAKAVEKEELENKASSQNDIDPTSPKFLRRQGPPPCVRFYDARARVALGLVSLWLQVPPRKLATLEVLLGSEKAHRSVQHRNDSSAASDRYRYLKVGLAAVGGGALFAVTGGLAAPAIAAGVGSLLGIVPGAGAAAGAVAGFMSTQVGVAAVTTTMATAGAATTGTKMAYRTADVRDFGFVPLKENMAPAALPRQAFNQHHAPRKTSSIIPAFKEGIEQQNNTASTSDGSNDDSYYHRVKPSDRGHISSSVFDAPRNNNNNNANNNNEKDEETVLLPSPLLAAHPAEGIKLSCVVGVSGWISKSPEDYTSPWNCISAPSADKFALLWCTSELKSLNSALGALLARGAAGQAARLGMQHLLVGAAGLVSALGPTVILGAATGLLIENAWTVALDRSDKAGKMLAHVLMSGGSGGRPVTLVAHSMGARLVFSALLELCRCGARGLVQDAVLLGAPIPPVTERWKMARRVVAGRLVNGYSRADWLLSILFWQGIAKSAAGLAPVEVEGVENISLGAIVGGHFDYISHLDEIIELLQVNLQ